MPKRAVREAFLGENADSGLPKKPGLAGAKLEDSALKSTVMGRRCQGWESREASPRFNSAQKIVTHTLIERH